MNPGEVIARQRALVAELERLLARHGTGIDALTRLVHTGTSALEHTYRQRAYLGLMIGLHPESLEGEPDRGGIRVAEIVRTLDALEDEHFIRRRGHPGEILQRRAMYSRVAWPRSMAQVRVGLAVRFGLQAEEGNYSEGRLLRCPSPADHQVETTFTALGPKGVHAADVLVALSRLAALFDRVHRGTVDAPALAELVDERVSCSLLQVLLAMLRITPDAIQQLWKAQRWRSATMGHSVVPHGASAAEFRPLLLLPDGRHIAPVPRAVAIAAEHLVDDLALGRGDVWPSFAGMDDAEVTRVVDARGVALELAVASALRDSLARGVRNEPTVAHAVHYTTSPERWSPEGEIDVLVGCGAIQVAVECKANGYDGRNVAPREFVGKPVKQLAKWRRARAIETLRLARDDRGTPYAPEEERCLRETTTAPIAIDLVLTLDDFGLMPTASPIIFRQPGGSLPGQTSPIYMCLPDLWELCQVLDARDLITYLTLRAQLAHSDIENPLAEDGCLAQFLATGNLYARSESERLVLNRATHDPRSLFAWKRQAQHDDRPTLGTPKLQRAASLQRLLDSLGGPMAEVAHTVIAISVPSIPSPSEREAYIMGEHPAFLCSPSSRTMLILDRLPEGLAAWTRSPEYADQIRDAFREGAAPELLVIVHSEASRTEIAIDGDIQVLVEPFIDSIAPSYDCLGPKLRGSADTGSRTRELLERLAMLDLGKYSPCPCGSGKQFRWCVQERGHPVPLRRPKKPLAVRFPPRAPS